MFSFNHYVPILKGKDGEFGALKNLSPETKKQITPFIDIPRVPLVFPAKKPKLSLEEHLAKIAHKIRLSWGRRQSAFIDLFDIKLSARTTSNDHPLQFLHECLQNEGIQAILVTGLDRDSQYNNTLANILAGDSPCDVCFRLQDDDLDIIEDTLDELEDLLYLLKISPKSSHLLLDFRSIKEDTANSTVQKIATLINNSPNIMDWKTLTVAGSSYPESLAVVPRDSVKKISRIEFAVWNYIIKNGKKLKRLPAFGDYGTVNPDTPILDPRTMNPSAKIRYTIDNEWLILKGHILKKYPKYQQYHLLSMELVRRNEYLGRKYSWGDQYIMDCAYKRVKTGNLTTWVKVDTNHHLTFVAKQIANVV